MVKYRLIIQALFGVFMQEVINSITEAEQRAEEIKARALTRAAQTEEDAEARSAEIAALSEAECKAYREKGIKEAEALAESEYVKSITVQRAEAAQYCADRLKNADVAVSDIVRRITRGSR